MSKARLARKHINGFLGRFGYEIDRFSPSRQEFFISRNIDTVVDVGANIGQFGREIRDLGFRGQIYSFEPMSKAYERLLKEAEKDNNWKAVNLGVSDRAGETTINISEYSVFSSLHEIKASAGNFDARSRYTSTEKIRLQTLSSLSKDISGSNIFLKIDTQGHEASVLKGMENFVDRVIGVQLELPVVKIYEQEWGISNYIDYMQSIGFVPAQFKPVNFHSLDRSSVLEVDCIFRRLDPKID